MRLTIIGSGTAIIRRERRGPSFLLEVEGSRLLLDCGWGCPEGLLLAHIPIESIDHYCISHPHADHLGSLVNLLQSLYVTGEKFSGRWRKEPITLHGYQGFAKDYETLRRMMFPERLEPYTIKVYEYSDKTRQFGKLSILAREVRHVPEYFHSAAFRIGTKDMVFAYSGDSAYDEALVAIARNADCALFEVSTSPGYYKEHGPRKTHLSPAEAGILAHKAGAKRLVLFHLYDDATEKEITEAVREHYSEELIISRDLQVIEMS